MAIEVAYHQHTQGIIRIAMHNHCGAVCRLSGGYVVALEGFTGYSRQTHLVQGIGGGQTVNPSTEMRVTFSHHLQRTRYISATFNQIFWL